MLYKNGKVEMISSKKKPEAMPRAFFVTVFWSSNLFPLVIAVKELSFCHSKVSQRVLHDEF